MTVNMQRLRDMLLGTGQHQPAPAPSWLSPNQAGASTAAAMPMSNTTLVPSHQGYKSAYMAASPLPMIGQGNYTEFLALAAVDLAKRGVRLDGSLRSREMISSYKRKRDEQSASLHGLAQAKRHQTIIVDHLLLNHASKMWEDLAKQRQKHMRLVTSAAEDRAAKRLKAKDEEIRYIRGMNWSLQERLGNLHMQAQMWRGIARSNAAASNVLRGDLQRALDAQAVHDSGIRGDVDDASSCCWGDYHVDLCRDNEYAKGKLVAVASAGPCKGCGQGEPTVLLLPCRHLSLCALCAAKAKVCPGCGCTKTTSICVNLS